MVQAAVGRLGRELVPLGEELVPGSEYPRAESGAS